MWKLKILFVLKGCSFEISHHTASCVSVQDELCCAVIGYRNEQDDAILPVRDYPLYPEGSSVIFLYSQPFID